MNDNKDLRKADEFARDVDATLPSTRRRIRLKVLKVAAMSGRTQLLDPIYSRIRYYVGERARMDEGMSLREIGRILEQIEADKAIEANLTAGKDEESIIEILYSKFH